MIKKFTDLYLVLILLGVSFLAYRNININPDVIETTSRINNALQLIEKQNGVINEINKLNLKMALEQEKLLELANFAVNIDSAVYYKAQDLGFLKND